MSLRRTLIRGARLVGAALLALGCAAAPAEPAPAARPTTTTPEARTEMPAPAARTDAPEAAGRTDAPAAATAMPLRVMTFNVRYGTAKDGENAWPNRRELLVDVIRAFGPDLLGVQEAHRFQLDEMLAALKGFRFVGVGRSDGKSAGEHSAIVYRAARFDVSESGTFWLSDTPAKPGSRSWGNEIPRIATWARLRDRTDGTRILLVNTHLDHQNLVSRQRSAEAIGAWLGAQRRDDEAVIVTGDFNAPENESTLLYLAGARERAAADSDPVPMARPLRDSFRIVHPDATDVATFHDFRGPPEATPGARRIVDRRKIDYVLVDALWSVESAEIVRTGRQGRWPSDHYPVTATLRRLSAPAGTDSSDAPARSSSTGRGPGG